MKMDFALNNLQWFICNKTELNQTDFNKRVDWALFLGRQYSYI